MFEEAENLRADRGHRKAKIDFRRRLQLPLSFTITFTQNNRGEFNINLTCT